MPVDQSDIVAYLAFLFGGGGLVKIAELVLPKLLGRSDVRRGELDRMARLVATARAAEAAAREGEAAAQAEVTEARAETLAADLRARGEVLAAREESRVAAVQADEYAERVLSNAREREAEAARRARLAIEHAHELRSIMLQSGHWSSSELPILNLRG